MCVGQKQSSNYSRANTDVKHKLLGLETWRLFTHIQEMTGHFTDTTV
jgi:hypothetical protein